MNPTVIAMGIAGLAAGGLVFTLGAASLFSGGLHFLLGKPKLRVLKSKYADRGFAFGLDWNSVREPVVFDKVKIRLFNPFGSPSQIEVSHTFPGFDSTSSADVEMGPGMDKILKAKGLEKATIQIEVGASQQNVFHQFDMKAHKFMALRDSALESAGQFAEEHKVEKAKPLYPTAQRSFIAGPLPKTNKTLKLATNPVFAGELASAGASEAPQENFAVNKVWIEPGCIVCNACEAIYPEVFEVTDSTCIIRPGAPLHDGLKILESAEACPVEVIKFEKKA